MRAFKHVLIFILSAPLVWAQIEMLPILREATEVSKDTARLEADWLDKEREFKAKIELLKSLKKSLLEQKQALIAKAKEQTELESDLNRRLAESRIFEEKLAKLLDGFAKDFSAKADERADTKIILADVLNAINSKNADVYLRASDIALSMQKALNLSDTISAQTKLGGRYLRLGVSALIDVEKSEGACEAVKMLDGELPYNFVKIELSNAKDTK